jgi:hypothetical protein
MKRKLTLLTPLLFIFSACSTTNIDVENSFLPKTENNAYEELMQEPIEEANLEINIIENIETIIEFVEPKLASPLPFAYDSTSMPKPFYEMDGISGGDCVYINRFYMFGLDSRSDLNSVCGTLIDRFTTDENFYDWINGKDFLIPVSSLMDYSNTISFIIDFNVPLNELRELWVEQRIRGMELEIEWDVPESMRGNYFTDEEIDIILSLDEARILEHFASEYVLLHDGRGFTPAWIYWHSTEDYKTVGITPEMLEERLELYSEFNFTLEATLAFEEKLSEFMGIDVVLDTAARSSVSDVTLNITQ